MSTATIAPALGDIGSDIIKSDTQGIDTSGTDVGGMATGDIGGIQLDPGAANPGAPKAKVVSQPGTTTTTSTGKLPGATGIGGRIIAAAEQYLGVDYEWGGTSAQGVDCSGLVQLAYKAAGIDLPRVSFEQAASGTRVAINALRPGDLLAVDNSSRNPGADHIAIYLGNGMMIEAPHPGAKVQIVPVSYMGKGAYGVRMGWS